MPLESIKGAERRREVQSTAGALALSCSEFHSILLSCTIVASLSCSITLNSDVMNSLLEERSPSSDLLASGRHCCNFQLAHKVLRSSPDAPRPPNRSFIGQMYLLSVTCFASEGECSCATDAGTAEPWPQQSPRDCVLSTECSWLSATSTK